MLFKTLKFALVGCVVLAAASSAVATPIVTMQQNVAGAFTALDFFYSSTPGGEFVSYRLDVQDGSGLPLLQDPSKPDTSDQGGDAVDTWMNTVGSLLGAGSASYNFNTYRPTGFGSDTPPRPRIDWTVFDTLTGDGNSIDGFPPAPYHLARVLTTPGSAGSAVFTAFDTLTLDEFGAAQPTVFNFPYGVLPPGFEVDDLTIGPRQAGALVVGGPLATNDSDDPDSLTWLLESLTGPGGAISLVGPGAPTVGLTTGVFSWQSLASNPLGAYSALIRGTNSNAPIGTDTGTLSFNLVPEPASITLLGLAMVGAIGFIRRR